MLSFFITSNKVLAVNENKKVTFKQTFAGDNLSGPYCGVSCIYAAIKLYGNEIAFSNLLRPDYVESQNGSSFVGLKKAAEDNGLYAVPLRNLTTQALRHSSYLMILRVKSDVTKSTYDHYELFLGTQKGKAKIFNPPEPTKLMPFSELASRWDRSCLIVSTESINLGAFLAPTRRRLILYFAIGMVIILGLHWAKGTWRRSVRTITLPRLLRLSAAQGTGLTLAALLTGMIYHFASHEGFLANANTTTSIQQAHAVNFIPKVNATKVEKLLNSNTVFVDARLARDFKAGHLEGAISVPVDADDIKRQTTMAGIDKEAKIVIYCQSAGCPYADKVAKKLKADGFSNISIFKGGWQEWKTKNNDLEEI